MELWRRVTSRFRRSAHRYSKCEPTLNQRVRGSSPWRRTPSDLRFLQHARRVWLPRVAATAAPQPRSARSNPDPSSLITGPGRRDRDGQGWCQRGSHHPPVTVRLPGATAPGRSAPPHPPPAPLGCAGRCHRLAQLRMAEDVHHHPHGHALLQQQRRRSMLGHVHPHITHPSCGQQLLPLTVILMRRHRATIRPGDDQWRRPRCVVPSPRRPGCLVMAIGAGRLRIISWPTARNVSAGSRFMVRLRENQVP